MAANAAAGIMPEASADVARPSPATPAPFSQSRRFIQTDSEVAADSGSSQLRRVGISMSCLPVGMWGVKWRYRGASDAWPP